MQTYKEYAPTQFDTKGLGLDDRQDWLVLGLIRTRDSEVLERVNFESALESLGGESETVEVHRFGHWGPGWFEIILIDPSLESKGADIESSLEDYPVLDESKLSEAESEEYYHNWNNAGACSDFTRQLMSKFRGQLTEAEEDYLDYDVDKDDLLGLFESLIPSGEYHTGDCWPNTTYAVGNCDLETLQNFVAEHLK